MNYKEAARLLFVLFLIIIILILILPSFENKKPETEKKEVIKVIEKEGTLQGTIVRCPHSFCRTLVIRKLSERRNESKYSEFVWNNTFNYSNASYGKIVKVIEANESGGFITNLSVGNYSLFVIAPYLLVLSPAPLNKTIDMLTHIWLYQSTPDPNSYMFCIKNGHDIIGCLNDTEVCFQDGHVGGKLVNCPVEIKENQTTDYTLNLEFDYAS